jgi:hypothetical protein
MDVIDYMHNIRNFKRIVIGSDHFLIVLKFIAKLKRKAFKGRKIQEKLDIPKAKKFEFNAKITIFDFVGINYQTS